MRRPLGIPLTAAILLVAMAVPATAAKPEPTTEVVDQTDLAAACVIDIEVSVPVGGKRVVVVEAGDESWSDGEFLNGTTSVLHVEVAAGTETVDVHLFDPQGRQVYRLGAEVSCVISAPPPPAT